MKVHELIDGFEHCKNFSLNLRDEEGIVWFFGSIKDAMDKIPDWCLDKIVKEFEVVSIHIPNSFVIMVSFCE